MDTKATLCRQGSRSQPETWSLPRFLWRRSERVGCPHERSRTTANFSLAAVLTLCLTVCGCAGFWGHLGYWSGASLVEPEYGELEGKRVAVVCVCDSTSYGSGTEGRVLARQVGKLLAEYVSDIELVSQSEIADWVDRNGWDAVDYREVGSGVKADRVIALDLAGLTLSDDQVLFKGRAALTITVLDMADGGREVFRRNLPSVTFPTTGFYTHTETNKATFRQVFLNVLAKRAAQHFYEYDALNESKLDPAELTL